MSDWGFLIDTIREIYFPELDENLSIEEFVKILRKTTSALDIARSIAEQEGDVEEWERQGRKIWGKIVGSPAGQKYLVRK